MAKKTVKKEEQTSVEVKELKTDISTQQFTDEELSEYKDVESNPDFTKIGVATSKKNLKNISMEELIAYKNGCEIICNHYENLSRLDTKNSRLFTEFNSYATMIINELEIRVREICNNND